MAVSFLNLFYYIQVATGDATPDVVYWLLALIAPSGFALGMDKALLLEINTELGVQASTLWDGPGLPIAGSLIMLAVDVLLYIFMAYYLDSVLPSKCNNFHFSKSTHSLVYQLILAEYGARKSPWFCLVPSFWFGTSKKKVQGQWNAAYEHNEADNVTIDACVDQLETDVDGGNRWTLNPFRRRCKARRSSKSEASPRRSIRSANPR